MNKLLVPVAAAATGLAYSLWEATNFALHEISVPVLPIGSAPLRVLHLADIHMMPSQAKKQAWLHSLAALEPDLIINTGDNISNKNSVLPILRAYGDLLDVPGVFVFGSNDYISPQPKNPFTYLRDSSNAKLLDAHGEIELPHFDLPWRELKGSFIRRGWHDLTNQHAELVVNGTRLAFVGVDDPHLGLDELDDEPARPDVDLAIGVTHAPYLRVLDRWNALGYPLILAGHTHGGQLCIPGYGAVITNCDLDTARVKGLSRHSVDGNNPSWLHVSAGLGTSPYQPVRFACRPEATLLTLTEIDSLGPR